MSTSTYGNLAIARPTRYSTPQVDSPSRRHLEIAPSRSQRRARPRLAHAIATVAGIGAILLVQLLLSFLLADGAYQISGLQANQRELLRDEQALSEHLELLGSTQNLTANAEALGMVASGNPQFLNVANGQVSGAGSSSVELSKNLIGNSLLEGVAVVEPATADSTVELASNVTTPGTLPSPTTH